MDWDGIDWSALERLRTAFLQGSAGQQDYWRSERDLASYDLTFAQRIGWKWDYVLEELTKRGWSPPGGRLLDWGCGSGVAGRVFLGHFGPASVSSLVLSDRSSLAVHYASKRATERFPSVPALTGDASVDEIGTLLLSHVLTELDSAQADALSELAERATAVVWVEPGTHAASRRLSHFRDRLRNRFNVVAPCTHQSDCPILLARNAAHWCHHFATTPPAVFTDGRWARFATLAGVDLRSLPLSFVVLDKRPVPASPPGAARVVGRPELLKGHALLLGCDSNGLHERRLTKRHLPDAFRRIKKGQLHPLQVWKCEGDEIVRTATAFDEIRAEAENGPD